MSRRSRLVNVASSPGEEAEALTIMKSEYIATLIVDPHNSMSGACIFTHGKRR